MKRIFIYCALPLLTAACGRSGDFDATGTFEATEVVVSAEATGRILRFDAEEGDLLELMHDAVAKWEPSDEPLTLGRVLRVGDGVATVTGLDDAFYGEILVFQPGARGGRRSAGGRE